MKINKKMNEIIKNKIFLFNLYNYYIYFFKINIFFVNTICI